MAQAFDAKVVLLGATSVGKTCIVTRAISDFFDPEQTATVGASFSIKAISIGSTTVNLRIWDTAGQERFKSLAPMYYQGSQAAAVVFSLTDMDSFNEAENWVTELRSHFDKPPLLYLIGNKLDLIDQRSVTEEQAQQKATQLGAVYFEASAKTGQGVNEIFENIADALVNAKDDSDDDHQILSVNDNNSIREKEACKC